MEWKPNRTNVTMVKGGKLPIKAIMHVYGGDSSRESTYLVPGTLGTGRVPTLLGEVPTGPLRGPVALSAQKK